MTTCKECKAQISTTAAACPQCGAKRKKTSGCALIVAGFFALVMLSALMRACSGDTSTSTPTTAAAKPTSPAAPAQPAKTDPALVFAQAKGTVDEVEARIKENAERLKKYYGTADQVKRATEDGIKLAVVKGLYGDSKVKEELALSKRADALIPKLIQQQRVIYASSSEEIFVKNNMDVDVSARGPNKDQLRLEYVLMSQPLVYKFQNEVKLSEQAKQFGFKKIIYTDGYNETWTVDLN